MDKPIKLLKNKLIKHLMPRELRGLCIVLAAAVSMSAMAQNQSPEATYDKAAEYYRIGRLEDAKETLNANWRNYKGLLYVEACRIMVLCLLEQDWLDEAEAYAKKLLTANPYYTAPAGSPERYVDLIESIKGGESMITTASHLVESPYEAPLPTIIITAEMIRNSGARTLQELLCLYVPGMIFVEGYDTQVAMRGFYEKYQENILVLLNGHRLNSRATNAESLDHRNSLDKIKEIEVLRGPVSSVCGGVALTAAVNIITKDGDEADAVEIGAGAGNDKMRTANLLMGGRQTNLNYVAWFNIYADDATKNKYPSTDAGISLRMRDFGLMLNSQQSARTVMGFDHGRRSNHIESTYAHKWKRVNLRGRAYGDTDDGTADSIRWSNWTAGTEVAAVCDYLNDGEIGNILLGAQAERTQYEADAEKTASAFIQLKQSFGPVLLNGGFRFDYKKQHDNNSLYTTSPRIAIILTTSPGASLKATYSYSFADAPYICRKNTSRSNNLDFEKLQSLQVGASKSMYAAGLNMEANFSHNTITDIISVEDSGVITNRGNYKAIGAEGLVALKRPRHTAGLTLSWLKVLDTENYSATSEYVYNIPDVAVTAHYSVSAIKNEDKGELRLRANLTVEGGRHTLDRSAEPSADRELDGHTLLNIGATYVRDIFTVGADVYNLLGADYMQGGGVPTMIKQPGRQFTLKVAVRVK